MTALHSRRLPMLGLLLAAPLFAAYPDNKEAPPTLTDVETQTYLDRDELAQWVKLARDHETAERAVAHAEKMAQGPNVALKGYQAETPEQRKAKADKLAADAKAKLAELDKASLALKTAAYERARAGAVVVTLPVRKLPEAMKASADTLLAAATAAGCDRLALTGTYTDIRGTLVPDGPLTAALKDALASTATGISFAPAPAFADGALKLDSDKTGVLVAEVYPLPAAKGALWSVKLIDGKTFAVIAADLAVIPADKPASSRYYYEKEPTAYTATLLDKNNFLGRLGAAEKWSFSVESTGPDAALLRAVLRARGIPALNDYAFLAGLLRGRAPDTRSKAVWTIGPGAGEARYTVGSRRAGASGAGVPVGELSLAPVQEKR